MRYGYPVTKGASSSFAVPSTTVATAPSVGGFPFKGFPFKGKGFPFKGKGSPFKGCI